MNFIYITAQLDVNMRVVLVYCTAIIIENQE